MRILFLITILLTVTSLANAADTRPFVWADDEDYWPAIYRGKDGKPAGIFNDILTEVFARLDIPLKKAVYPWTRAQEIVKEGNADGMVTVYTKERQVFLMATRPIWHIGETLFFRRDNPRACELLKLNSFEEMQDLRVVDIVGAGWKREKFKEHGINNVIRVPTVDSAFDMLARGKVDIFMMFNLNAFNKLLKKRAEKGGLSEGYQKIIAISPSFASLPFQLLINRDSPFVNRIDDINRVLEVMKKDGTYQRIRKKYVGITPIL